jgi:hypothetical protein
VAALAAVIGLFAFSGAAFADVVTFDDLTGSGQLPDGYAGITWNDNWHYYDDFQPPYTPASGAERVYNRTSAGDFPEPAIFNFGSAVVFDGAYFAGYDITTVSFDLYYLGVLVHTSAGLIPTAVPTFLASGYGGPVDEVRVHDSGFFGVFDYYVMDDVTFHAVPEPATLTLFGAGALGLVARYRRRRTTAGN